MPLSPGFESWHARLSPPGCFTCLLGLQGVQWIQGLVVVRVSWPGHPGLQKKKKSCNNNWQSKIELIITFNLPNKQQTAEISMENEVEGKGQISSSFSLL